MPLTREQFGNLRKQGISVDRIADFERGIVPPEKVDTSGNQFDTEPEGFFAKARDFATNIIGGGALAEGLGKGLAAPKLQRGLSEVEMRMADIDLAAVKRIREKKERGEDTTRLENSRNQLIEEMKGTRDVQEDFVASLPSNAEVIGSAVRLGATLVAPTIGGKAVKATALGRGVTGVGSGILRGAGAGAVAGGIEGTIQGI